MSGAIRTDLILSAEIMAISLAAVSDQPFFVRAPALAAVGLAITAGVYGVVGLIVKMDDIGLSLARRKGAVRRLGCGLVKAMPPLLSGLSIVGTAAMLWVGGGILVHGLEQYRLTPVPGLVHHLQHWAGAAPGVGPAAGWLAFAVASAVVGLIVGGLIAAVLHFAPKRRAAQ